MESRNFQSTNEKNETGAVAKTRRDKIGVPCNGKQQDSVQEETIPVSAPMGMKVENQHPSMLLLLNREKMVNILGKLNRKTCREFLEGQCTNPSCEFWNAPECQNY